MNIALLRWIDRWIGSPLCLGFDLWRRLGGGPPPPGAPSRGFLIIKLAEQGSTVLAGPAIARAIELAGRERVFLLCFEENRAIVDILGVIPPKNVLTIGTASVPRALLDSVRAVRRLRRVGVDTAIDLEFFARSTSILAFLSGAQRRVGCHSFAGEGPWRGDLMTHRVVYNPHWHTGDFFLALVEAAGFAADGFPAFPLTRRPVDTSPAPHTPLPRELGEVRRLLQEAGIGGTAPIVLLNANCGDLLPLRRWPVGRYVELGRRLLERDPEVRVAFTGGARESETARGLACAVGSTRCVSLAGRTTLRQLLALYHLTDVLVTNDSGPAQFAAMTPINAVVLFGPETPALYAPRSPRCRVLWAGLACSPCVSAFNGRDSRCRDNRCLQAIDVDAVLAAVDDARERRARAAGPGS